MYTRIWPSGITHVFLKHTLWSPISTHVGTDPPAKPSSVSACQNPTHFFKAHPNISSSVWPALVTPVKNNIASSNIALVSFLRPLSHKACVICFCITSLIDPKQLGNSSIAWICIFIMIPGSVLNVRGTSKVLYFWVTKNWRSGKFKGVDT